MASEAPPLEAVSGAGSALPCPRVLETRFSGESHLASEETGRGGRPSVKGIPHGAYVLAHGDLRLACRDEIPRDAAERWLRGALPAALAGQGRGVRLARVPGPSGAGELLAKREWPPLHKSLLRAFLGRPSRSMKALHIGLHLQSRGVSAARAVAVLEGRRWGIVRQSALILEPSEGLDLREFILSRLGGLQEGHAKDCLKTALLSAIARGVAALHASGVRQRDLKAPNILVAEPEDRLELTLLDLEGMALPGSPPSLDVRLRDLARLAVSFRESRVRAAGLREEDWRFLVTSYLSEWRGAAPEPPELEEFLRRALAWARRKEERNQRRGRPIE
jgi:hypothetical protein